MRSDSLMALRMLNLYVRMDTPVVGEVLYLRETVHMAIESTAIANQSETNYQAEAIKPEATRLKAIKARKHIHASSTYQITLQG